MTGRIAAAATLVASIALGAGAAIAGCAEDLTRIELAAASASTDVRDAVAGLVATAQARAKANDATGCATATAQAMRLLGLPNLAPITLSTPVPGIDRQPQPPHPPAAGSHAAGVPDPARATDGARAGAPPSAPVPAAPAKTTPDQDAQADWYVVTSNLVGSDVTADDRPDDSIGSIKALVIDSTTGQASLALIETGGLLGFGGKLVAVPFGALQFFGRWDRPMVRASLATLQSGPRVTTANILDLVSKAQWRADLAKHFNIPIAPPSATARPRVVAAAAPGDAAAGDAAAGHSYVQGICGACHTFDQGGGTRVGPALYGIVDRTIAGEPGYSYSAALKQHSGSWTAANLDGFLKRPQAFAPGTTMPFSGISSDRERRNVIAYLETLRTAPGGPK